MAQAVSPLMARQRAAERNDDTAPLDQSTRDKIKELLPRILCPEAIAGLSQVLEAPNLNREKLKMIVSENKKYRTMNKLKLDSLVEQIFGQCSCRGCSALFRSSESDLLAMYQLRLIFKYLIGENCGIRGNDLSGTRQAGFFYIKEGRQMMSLPHYCLEVALWLACADNHTSESALKSCLRAVQFFTELGADITLKNANDEHYTYTIDVFREAARRFGINMANPNFKKVEQLLTPVEAPKKEAPKEGKKREAVDAEGARLAEGLNRVFQDEDDSLRRRARRAAPSAAAALDECKEQ
jgi:hypothetical protein